MNHAKTIARFCGLCDEICLVFIWLIRSAIVCCLIVFRAAYAESPAGQALSQAVQGTSAAAIVLDAKSGKTLAVVHPEEAVRLRSAPGSTLKPFFLAYALEHGFIQPQTTVLCRRSLRIAGRNLDCTHPQGETVFNAELALAYSCNNYFAELAKRFTPEEAANALHEYGLAAQMENGASLEQRQFLVLGLEDVRVTPDALARAYLKLVMQWINGLPDAVKRGLEESVQYGMAHNAYIAGVRTAGKTGTASDPGQPWTHGWFAGIAPADQPKIVIVVYLPRGNGADAAQIAQRFLSAYKDSLR
jgi:cell division protein FtsI/penicillin-binding protein 2